MIFADFTKTVKKSHKRRQTLDAIPDCGPVQLKIDHSSSAGPSVPYSKMALKCCMHILLLPKITIKEGNQ